MPMHSANALVIDERRGNGPKAARPEGVVAGSPSDCVALNATGLARVPDPRCTTLLAEKLPATITVGKPNLIWLQFPLAKPAHLRHRRASNRSPVLRCAQKGFRLTAAAALPG